MIIFVFNGQGQREESRTTTRHQLEMASAMIKSSFRSALRVGASRGTPAFKRTFASSAHHDEAREAAKWEKITYVGIITCTVLAIVNLSKGHPHHEEPPASKCCSVLWMASIGNLEQVRMVFSRRSITKPVYLSMKA
ncbi:cytochrome c oxidase subunit 6a, mitochondrial-like isoform X1 [Nicotiana tabacum]|uniref:Cytochrome c oxidase subunit 6a, mitochondrial-like isoform X1 n=1 Tax=Nicotiana tabacum TaxID=4097 RepID=A0AC58SLK1_TOBAC